MALEEARLAARSAELRAAAAAETASKEARSASAQAERLSAEQQSLAAAVSSLQVCALLHNERPAEIEVSKQRLEATNVLRVWLLRKSCVQH